MNRSKQVTVRVSPAEYAIFQRVTETIGARSVSSAIRILMKRYYKAHRRQEPKNVEG